MLRKLIAYEMKAYGRILVPIYIALLALAAILGLSLKFLPAWTTQNVFFVFAVLLYIILLLSVVVVTTLLAINRYYGNLLGREGYFMFSLPVRSSTLMVSKTLSAMIWTAFGTIVGFAAVAMVSIVAFNGTDYIEFKQALHMFYKEIISPNIGHVIFWIAIMILVLVTVIVRVYAAVAIGSQWSGHRLLGSVLAYVGIKIVETIIASVISSVDFLKNGVEHLMWNSPADVNGFTNWRLQIVVLAIIAVQIVIYWVLAWYFTDRRLNLE